MQSKVPEATRKPASSLLNYDEQLMQSTRAREPLTERGLFLCRLGLTPAQSRAKGQALWNPPRFKTPALATLMRFDDNGGMNVFTTDHPMAAQPTAEFTSRNK